MIRLTLAISTLVFYSIRWRPSVLRRVATRKVSVVLAACDLLFFLLVTYQLYGMPHLQFWPPTYINYVGLTVAMLGATLATSARLTLKQNYLPAWSTTASRSLTLCGPYRFVRHPSYLGTILAFIGFELALGNVLIVLALPFVFFVCKQIEKEERILSDFHDGEWQRFAARTPYKLLPYLY